MTGAGSRLASRSATADLPERLAGRLPAPVTYVATTTVGDDADLAARVAAHRARRPSDWPTVEAGSDLAGALAGHPTGTVLVESIGPWLAAHHDFAVDLDGLVAALLAREGDTVVVSEEVGLAVHPPTELGRRFVDAIGTVNQALADAADEVLLVVAGRALPLLRVQE